MSDYPLRVRYYVSSGTHRDNTNMGGKFRRRADAQARAIEAAGTVGESVLYRFSNDESRSPARMLARYVRLADGTIVVARFGKED